MKRRRLSIDLDTKANQDVARMLDTAKEKNPGTPITWFAVNAMRRSLIKSGFGPKKSKRQAA
jgi:hypothetical protein